jgi:hypothetical protein
MAALNVEYVSHNVNPTKQPQQSLPSHFCETGADCRQNNTTYMEFRVP